jgi:hypothetical protein
MPLQALKFKPGVNRESTTLANEGTWFEMDKVRFRSGYPEKIGGWQKDGGQSQGDLPPPTGSFWGVCRSLFNWVTIRGYNLLGLGTHLKYYIQNSTGGPFYDVTPIRATATIASNAFTTTNGSTTVTVNDAGHGAEDGDFVTISGVSGAVNGIPSSALNDEFRITYVDSNEYTITVSAPATSSGTTGAADFEYQINIGSDIATTAAGFGAGGWGGVTGTATPTGWGESAATGVDVTLRLWSQANYGDWLISNYRGGGLYLWVPAASANTFYRAQQLSSTNTNTQDGIAYWETDAECPTVANMVTVSDSSRFVIAFGCDDYSSSTQDPLLIRWSDQEDYTVWTPSATNQAGSYRLSQGSTIVANLQTRQEILVWTDGALYAMQYLGAPYVWGFQILDSNISIASPNARVSANNITFWMGVDKFYVYSGRVETLNCDIWKYIFEDINFDQQDQIICGSNERYNEVWWFYPSAGSTVIDKYVIYNYLEKTWAYGTMARTAWLDSALRDNPLATGYNGQLFYHEIGCDDGATDPPSPITAYVQSADFDIGDGHNMGFVWRMIPDITFDGSTVNQPSATFTMRPRQNPGANYSSAATPTVTSTQNYQNERYYEVQQFTQIIYVRVRGRQMAFKVSSTGLGVAWQLGVPRMDLRPDGRR